VDEPEELSDHLAAWDAASRRGQARWLRQLADESASLAGVALDLAEHKAPAVVRLRHGAGLCTGSINAVGVDFLTVDTTLVPFAAVRSLQSEIQVAGDREPAGSITFAAAVARLAADRPRVRALLGHGESISGDLAAAGTDVLRIDTTWVPISAVCALVLL
jgi:hypothetical protein